MNTHSNGWDGVISGRNGLSTNPSPVSAGRDAAAQRRAVRLWSAVLLLSTTAGLSGLGCAGGNAGDGGAPVMASRRPSYPDEAKPMAATRPVASVATATTSARRQTELPSPPLRSKPAATAPTAMQAVKPVSPAAKVDVAPAAEAVRPAPHMVLPRQPQPEPQPQPQTPPQVAVADVQVPPSPLPRKPVTPLIVIPPVSPDLTRPAPAVSAELDTAPSDVAAETAKTEPASVPETPQPQIAVEPAAPSVAAPAVAPASAPSIGDEPLAGADPGPVQAAPYTPSPEPVLAPARPVSPEEQKLRDRVAAVKAELTSGRDVNDKDEHGRTLLQQAALAGELPVVELLLDWGANPNAGDRQGWTALHWAASSGHQEICELLIASGTPVDVQGFLNETPLYWAAVFDRHATVELLVARGAKVNAADKRGRTALHGAVEGDARQSAAVLIGLGADVKARDEAGSTPLHQVVVRLRKTLLGLADTAAASDGSDAALTSADAAAEQDRLRRQAIAGAREMARLMVENGADVNAATTGGLTPLHLSAWDDMREIADLLIAAGANIAVQDGRSRTPADYARQRGQKQVTKLLVAGRR